MKGKAFISYRKGLHLDEAKQLHAALESRLGRGVVVLDANQDAVGSAWTSQFRNANPSNTVMLVLASESWVDMRDETGARLLTLANDPVRQELLAGIEKKAAIIPVVLDGAQPISIARLPEELWPVFLRPAEQFRVETADHDADRLAALISEALTPEPKRMSMTGAALTAVGTAVAGLAVGVGLMLSSGSQGPTAITASVAPGVESAADASAAEALAAAEKLRGAAEARLAEVEAQLAKAQQDLAKAESDAKIERAALEASPDADALAEARKAQASAEDELAKAKEWIAVLETELADAQEALKVAQDELQSAEDKAAEKRATVEAKLGESEEQLAVLGTKLTEAEEKGVELGQQLTASRKKAAELEEKLAASEAVAATLDAKLTETEERADQLSEQLAESEEATATLEAKLAADSEAEGESEALDAEAIASAEAARVAAEERLATLEAELETAREALDNARTEAQIERALLEKKLAEAQQGVETARADASKRTAELEAELASLREAAATSEDELRRAVKAREDAVARAEAEEKARIEAEQRGESSGSGSDAQAAVAEAEEREAEAARKAERAAKAVGDAEGEIEATRAALETAEARLEELTAEAARLKAVTPRAVFEFEPSDDKTRIVRAQDALTSLGYEIGAIDGVIGRRTRAALKSFQGRAGLDETGDVDAGTLDALIIAEWYLGTAETAPKPEETLPKAPPPVRKVAVRVQGPGLKPLSSFSECRGCPEMMSLPAGDFLMGSTTREAGRVADEGPRRKVKVAAFAIGVYEVTFDEWNACVKDKFCRPVQEGRKNSGKLPVTNISWADITGQGVKQRGFVAWLNSKVEGDPYRLPTEAEWEYAARASTETRFSYGNDPELLGFFAWHGGNSNGQSRPIGGKRPNGWGLHDVHGNVREWVQDCWHANYKGAPKTAVAWMKSSKGQCSRAVLRGGAFDDEAWSLRSAYRGWSTRSRRRGDVGFRIARSL